MVLILDRGQSASATRGRVYVYSERSYLMIRKEFVSNEPNPASHGGRPTDTGAPGNGRVGSGRDNEAPTSFF